MKGRNKDPKQDDLVGRVIPEPRREDVVGPMTSNDTWAECRVCHRVWQEASTPGVIHHYVVCDRCRG